MLTILVYYYSLKGKIMRNPKIKEAQQLEFFKAVESMGLEDLRAYCINLIKNARVPNHTMANEMKTDTRSDIIHKMNDFILFGHGLGMGRR